MEVIEKKDLLNLAADPFVKSIISPNGKPFSSLIVYLEEIYLSCLITKYNRYGFKQERKIIVTNLHLFNISKQSNINRTDYHFSACLEINRKIDILKVDAVTLSKDAHSSEFIIHVKNEYDYRYLSQSYSELIAHTIRKIIKLKGQSIKFFKVVSLIIISH